jgi:hypothetical protein
MNATGFTYLWIPCDSIPSRSAETPAFMCLRHFSTLALTRAEQTSNGRRAINRKHCLELWTRLITASGATASLLV